MRHSWACHGIPAAPVSRPPTAPMALGRRFLRRGLRHRLLLGPVEQQRVQRHMRWRREGARPRRGSAAERERRRVQRSHDHPRGPGPQRRAVGWGRRRGRAHAAVCRVRSDRSPLGFPSKREGGHPLQVKSMCGHEAKRLQVGPRLQGLPLFGLGLRAGWPFSIELLGAFSWIVLIVCWFVQQHSLPGVPLGRRTPWRTSCRRPGAREFWRAASRPPAPFLADSTPLVGSSSPRGTPRSTLPVRRSFARLRPPGPSP